MAKQHLFAVAFALMVSSVQADSCKTVSSGAYQLINEGENLGGTYCATNSKGCYNFKNSKWVSCDCAANCCTPVANTCMWAASSGTVCGADHMRDATKDGAAVLADKSDFKTNCCMAKKVCDVTCASGMKKKSSYSTLKCAGVSCSQSECCDADSSKCRGFMGGLLVCVGSYMGCRGCIGRCNLPWTHVGSCADYCRISACYAWSDGNNYRCDGAASIFDTSTWLLRTGCGANKTYDSTKAGTAVTNVTFEATCCRTKITCQDFLCPTGTKQAPSAWQNKVQKKADITCLGTTCKTAECCAPKPGLTCSTFTPNAGKGCDPKTQYIFDAAKTRTVQADSSDFKKQCCTTKATCQAFALQPLQPGRVYGLKGQTGASMMKQLSAMAVLVVVAGHFLCGQ